MYWVERRYPQDKIHQGSHPKGRDLETISKVLTGLDEIVTLLKAQTDKTTEAIPPKVKPRRKRSKRGKKKKAMLSKAQQTAADTKETDKASFSSNVAAPRKQPEGPSARTHAKKKHTFTIPPTKAFDDAKKKEKGVKKKIPPPSSHPNHRRHQQSFNPHTSEDSSDTDSEPFRDDSYGYDDDLQLLTDYD